MTTLIISAQFQETSVFFQQDAYINATKAAKHFNKKVGDYLRLERTQDYINELSVAGFPATEENQLVIMRRGGKSEEQGTWLHPKLTIDFARWLSAKFAVWCDMQIEKILHPPKNALIEIPLFTPAQKQHLKKIIGSKVKVTGRSYSACYNEIFNKYNVNETAQLKSADYPDVCRLFGAKPKVFEGEIMPRAQLPAQDNCLTVTVGKELSNLKGVKFEFDTEDSSFSRWFVCKSDSAVSIQAMSQDDLCMSFDKWIEYATNERGYIVVKGSDVLSKLKS